MSKQSKNARKLAKERAMKGQKGPSQTTKSHTKVKTWYNSNSPTYWRKPKDTKKVVKTEAEKDGARAFKLLEEERQRTLRKLRAGME
jgi:hypothetical protein